MKKSGFVWFVIIVEVLSIVITVISVGGAIGLGSLKNVSGMTEAVFALIDVILAIIYTVKLFKMKGNLLLWTNIVFSFDLLTAIVLYFLYGSIDFLQPIWIIVWILFYRHLKKLGATQSV